MSGTTKRTRPRQKAMQEKRMKSMPERRSKAIDDKTMLTVFDIDFYAGIFCMVACGAEAGYHFIVNGTKAWGVQFGWQQIVFMLYTTPLFIMMVAKQVKYKKLIDLDINAKVIKLVTIIAFTIGLLITEIGFTFLFKLFFSIQAFEIILFYVDAAISEEMLFRVLIGTLVYNLLKRFGAPVSKFFAIVVSAVAFMLGHYFVYGSDINLMMATLVGGFVLGIAYIIFDNLTAGWIAHVVYNASVSGIKVVNSTLSPELALIATILIVLFASAIIMLLAIVVLVRGIKAKSFEITSRRGLLLVIVICLLASVSLISFVMYLPSSDLIPW